MKKLKTKFKEGDLVKIVKNNAGHSFKNGEVVRVMSVYKSGYACEHLDRHDWWGVDESDVTSYNSHPLIIKKVTRTRAGVKYHTWQFSKNKKISNHQFNSPSTRNKQLNQFIEDIRSGNFEIK